MVDSGAIPPLETEMIPPKVVGIYCAGVGIAMASLWVLFYVAGTIPGLETAPLEIGYHLLAEGLTAGFLLVAGYGLLQSRDWVASVLPVSLGMLLYTVINSAGYYAHRSDLVMVGMFTLLTLSTGVVVIDILRNPPVVRHPRT